MTPTPTVRNSFETQVLSFLKNASPIRYGVATVIVLSLGYLSIRIIPSVRRDLHLLREVNSVDEKGMSLESELLFEAQASRRRFLRALMAYGNSQAVDEETRAMRGFDSRIVATESRIAQLGGNPVHGQAEFHETWQRYLTQRDKILASALAGIPEDVRKIDSELGKSSFHPVEQAIRDAEQEFEARSASQIDEVSATLRTSVIELSGLVAVKTIVLFLVVWMDWKRIAAERNLQKARRDLKASEDRFRQAYRSAAVGMGMIKLDGTVLSANRKAAEILGFQDHELVGVNVADIMAPECKTDFEQKFTSLPQSDEGSYQAERRVIRKDGSAAWVRNSVTLLKPDGEEEYYFFISEEITQQKQANDRLAFLANYDPITSLPNRHYFEVLLKSALKSIAASTDCVALLYLEIDSFDYLKGSFGRTVADEVLSELGASLVAFRREGEILAKLDDNVFGMLITAAPYDEATLTRAGELRESIHRFGATGKHRIPVSASIGIAFSSEGAAGVSRSRSSEAEPEAGGLLNYARAAMLEARSRGGDSIFVADPALERRTAQRRRIEAALLTGLHDDEFRVVFQPQFKVATGRLVRFEALCRWTSKELGTVPPDRFIPIAEQTGLIQEIGRRVLVDALRQAKAWSDSGRKIGVAVNVSPMQFIRPDFINTITEVLAQTQFPAHLLELEITEGIFIRDLNVAVARIRELQRLGLSIALDDFGTGYSSLSYLQRMPIDAVKLDRSFVSDLTTESATVSMVRSVLEMASALNLRVVTEGVETEEQLQILRELGCEEAQGYLLGRPESAEMALGRVLESPMHRVAALA